VMEYNYNKAEALDVAMRTLVDLAKQYGVDWITVTARADGRVSFEGCRGPYTDWRAEADTHKDSALPNPTTALCVVLDAQRKTCLPKRRP
jgi:hypothetical protein